MTKTRLKAKPHSFGVIRFLFVLVHLHSTRLEAQPVKSDAKRALAQVEAAGIPAEVDFTNISGVVKTKETACFINVVGRGVGVPLNSCPHGRKMEGPLCYSPCKDGYYGVGPVCLSSCPPEFRDTGAFCIRTYGKGCCCTLFGCCGCPQGYTDDGCFCRRSFRKRSYGRGMGLPLVCGTGQVQSGALCYPRCPGGYSGVGPVCWNANGPKGFPVKCNEIVWALNHSTCNIVNTKLGIAGGASAVCIGLVFAALGENGLWSVAPEVCNSLIKDAVAAVKEIVNLTGARTCP